VAIHRGSIRVTQCEKEEQGKERPWGEILNEEQDDLPDLILYYGVENEKKKGGEGEENRI
jgi:hypothetical protein